jgi:hypothetical protein
MSGSPRDLTVGVVASTRAWRNELQTYVRNHVSGVRLIVLREPRALVDEEFDVVVIDDVATLLTKLSIKRLRQRGVGIVGVYDPDEPADVGQRLLRDLGVDVTLAATASAEEMLRQIGTLGPAAALQDEVRKYLDSLEPASPSTPAPALGAAQLSLLAVAGVSAEPAGCEVATTIATVLAQRGERVIVVDVNEVAPTLARYLAYALEPNLLSALDALRHGSGVGADPLAVRSPGASGSVPWDAIVGLANPAADWAQLRDADLVALLEELGSRWDRVVAVVGPHLEELEGLGPERFGATRATVAAADAVVGVAPATRLGVLAWLDWAADVEDLLGPRPLCAVLHRLPRSPFKQAELAAALRANVAPELLAGVFFLPEDPRVEDAAWQAAPLLRGPFVKAVGEIVAALVPTPPPPPRRAKAAEEVRSG